MKRIPKTPVEFDYDLWTTEDGKCMVRVKITGEVTEVDREVMKILRAEEKMELYLRVRPIGITMAVRVKTSAGEKAHLKKSSLKH